MTFAKPSYARSDVNRAGRILVAEDATPEEIVWAFDVLANWRACHGYPMNTFQATLRTRLKGLDGNAIVAQRLKRAPSVMLKLRRFDTMKLVQMQDVAGLRAVVSSVRRVRQLETIYRGRQFDHELMSSKDYIAHPKPDGYRSVHMVYRYVNKKAPAYNGLHIEMQFRTRLQHAWATAVETMGTFLGEALKAGQGSTEWLRFFEAASAALTHLERTKPVPGYEALTREEVVRLLAELESELRVLTKLQGFAIAANQITAEKGGGSYHLITLDSANRRVLIRPFAATRLEEANTEYAKIEERTQRGEAVEAVLVSAGPIEALRRAYPNYFLDTGEFVRQIERLIAEAGGAVPVRRRAR